MQVADEVAAKVKSELRRSRELRLSLWQRVGAGGVGLVVVATFVRSFFH